MTSLAPMKAVEIFERVSRLSVSSLSLSFLWKIKYLTKPSVPLDRGYPIGFDPRYYQDIHSSLLSPDIRDENLQKVRRCHNSRACWMGHLNRNRQYNLRACRNLSSKY